jgi:hypothetical protein
MPLSNYALAVLVSIAAAVVVGLPLWACIVFVRRSAFPELARFEDGAQAHKAVHLARREGRKTTRNDVLAMLLILALASIFLSATGTGGAPFVAPLGLLGASLGIVYALRRRHRRIRQSLRRQLIRRGDPICTNCGYDLRGLSASGHCPECGFRFEFRCASDG